MSEADGFSAPACPACASTTRLVRVIPAVAGHPALHSYQCTDCGEVVTTEAPPPAEA